MSFDQNLVYYNPNDLANDAKYAVDQAGKYMGNQMQQAGQYIGNKFNSAYTSQLNQQTMQVPDTLNKSFGNTIVDKITMNQKFTEKEAEINNKIGSIFDKLAGGKPISGNAEKFGYLINKILIILLLFSFLIDRYDIIGLFFSFGVLFLEPGFANRKYLYRWIIILALSVVMDLFCLLDILRYIGDINYKVGNAGAAMSRFGLFWTIIVLLVKCADGFCVWKMAINTKNTIQQPLANDIDDISNFHPNIKSMATGSGLAQYDLQQIQQLREQALSK